MRLNWLDWTAIVLVIIGALNWLLIGLFGFNLVTAIFGGAPIVVALIYILVGLAGLWMIYLATRISQAAPTYRA